MASTLTSMYGRLELVVFPSTNAADVLAQKGPGSVTGRQVVSTTTETLDFVQDNLLLLLEASHGTTMNTTTSLMYFLSHPDNRDCLEHVRSEVQKISAADLTGNDQPSLSDLKHEMLYCDGRINEAMRLYPIVGSVLIHLPKGKGRSTELRDGTQLSHRTTISHRIDFECLTRYRISPAFTRT
jgi:hypothetical protein